MLRPARRLSWMCVCAVGLFWASPASAVKVAVYGAPSTGTWNADVQAKIQATGLFTQVDAFLVASTTPTLAELLAYDSVLAYSDNGFSNAIAMGDVLADYM